MILYLMWIVIVVVAIVVIAAIVGGGDSGNTSQKVGTTSEKDARAESSDAKSSKAESSDQENKDGNSGNDTETYHPGDIVSFGDFQISYKSAEKYKSKNEFSKPEEGFQYITQTSHINTATVSVC